MKLCFMYPHCCPSLVTIDNRFVRIEQFANCIGFWACDESMSLFLLYFFLCCSICTVMRRNVLPTRKCRQFYGALLSVYVSGGYFFSACLLGEYSELRNKNAFSWSRYFRVWLSVKTNHFFYSLGIVRALFLFYLLVFSILNSNKKKLVCCNILIIVCIVFCLL